MDDLKERLRRGVKKPDGTKRRPSPRELEAADRIAALEADNARLMGLVKDAGEALGEGDGVQEVDRAIADQYWQRDCQDHDALSQTLSEVRSTAAAAERARIVAWLRGQNNGYAEGAGYGHAADAIERGEV